MKSVYIFVLSLVLLVLQKDEEHSVQVDIKDESQLYIKGTSNVNTFRCHYKKPIQTERLKIAYEDVDNGWLLEGASLYIESTSFDCGGKKINRDFKDLVKSDQFPSIRIEVCRLLNYDDFIKAQVEISIAEQSKFQDINVYTEEGDSRTDFKSVLDVNITDFNLEAPTKMMGLIKVDEEISIHITLNLEL